MKKEYWKREARRITAAVLALLLCVSVFAQTLPRAYAAEPDAPAPETSGGDLTAPVTPVEPDEPVGPDDEPDDEPDDGSLLPVEEMIPLLKLQGAADPLSDGDTFLTDGDGEYVAADGVFEFTVLSAADKTVSVRAASSSVSGSISIPAKAIGPDGFEYAVTRLEQEAFMDSGITAATIPSSITYIENYVFAGCTSLASVTLPASTEAIGAYAFKGCKALASIDIPDGVRNIYQYAFKGCTGLTEISLPSALVNLGEGAFQDCSGLEKVTFGDQPGTVGSYAFEGVGTSAKRCLMILPDSWVSTPRGGPFCFNYKSGYFTFPSLSVEDRFCVDANGVLCDPDNFTFRYEVIEKSNNLTPGKVILQCALADLNPNVTVPKIARGPYEEEFYVVGIGDYAFGSKPFESVTFSEGLEYIEECAFQYCTVLTSLTIPASVKRIDRLAFEVCTSLKTVTFKGQPTSLGRDLFYNVGTDAKPVQLIIPDSWSGSPAGSTGVFEWYEGKFSFEPAAAGQVFYTDKDGTVVAKTSSSAFFKFEVTSEPGVANPTAAISAAKSTTSGDVIIPESAIKGGVKYAVTEIAMSGFSGRTDITSVTIPASVETVGALAFSGCTGLTEVSLAEGVKRIGETAFKNCTGLEEIVIPASVTRIGTAAFSGCANLGRLELKGDTPGMDFDVFSGVGTDAEPCLMILPKGYTSYPAGVYGAFEYRLGWFTLGDPGVGDCFFAFQDSTPDPDNTYDAALIFTVTKAAEGGKGGEVTVGVNKRYFFAYYYAQIKILGTVRDCAGNEYTVTGFTKGQEFAGNWVKTLTLPDTITAIPDGEFKGCDLESLTLGSAVTEIGASAFADCTKLQTLNIPASVDKIGSLAFDKLGSSNSTYNKLQINFAGKPSTIAEDAFKGVVRYNDRTNINVPASWLADGLTLADLNDPDGDYQFGGSLRYSVSDCWEIGSPTASDMIAILDRETKTLTIRGKGDMMSWGIGKAPWGWQAGNLGGYIENIVFEGDITSIGKNAFDRTSVKSITIPASVTHIGSEALWNCSQLEEVVISGEKVTIDAEALGYNFQEKNPNPVSFVFLGERGEINNNAFYNNVGNVTVPSSWLTDGVTLDTLNDSPGRFGSFQYCGYLTYRISFGITVAKNIRGGTVTVKDDAVSAFSGDTVELTATPDTDYTFLEFVVTDAAGNKIPVTNGKFTMPGSDVTVSAKFKAPHDHQWTFTSSGNVIKAYCTDSECPDYYGESKALEFTLTAPAFHGTDTSYIYDGEPFEATFDTDANDTFVAETGIDEPSVTYAGVTAGLKPYVDSAAPTEAGSYSAIVSPTLDGAGINKPAIVEFEILKADQVIDAPEKVEMTVGETGKNVGAQLTTGAGEMTYEVAPAQGLTVGTDGALTAEKSGDYTVTVSAAATDNYNSAEKTVPVTVSGKTQTVTVADDSIEVVYGTPVTIAASTDGDGALSYTADSDCFTVDGTGKVTFVSATTGDATVTVRAAATDSFAAGETKVKVTTKKAPLTVEVPDLTAYIGDSFPTSFECTCTGLVGTDTLENICDSVGYAVRKTVGGASLTGTITAAGDYILTVVPVCGTVKTYDTCYDVTTGDGKLTVSGKRTQSVTLTSPASLSLTYGGDAQKVTATAAQDDGQGTAPAGAKTGDITFDYGTAADKDVVSIAADGTVTPLKPGTATVVVTAAESDCYSESEPVTVTVTVAKAALTITADSKNAKVGAEKPALTYQVSGLVGSDAVPASFKLTCDADMATAGSYDIVCGTITDTAFTALYDITYTNGTLTVSAKKTQTVTASAPTGLVYGSTGKKITASVTTGGGALSFADDGSGVLTVDPATGALTILKPGTAVVTVTAAENDTYAKATKEVPVTVGKAKLTITADGKSAKVGDTKPALTYQTSGLVGSDAIPAGFALTCDADMATAGTYDILCGTITDADFLELYDITYKNAALTVAPKKTQTITASAPTGLVYGSTGRKITASVTKGGGELSFADDGSGVLTVDPATGELTILKAGTAVVTVTAAENDTYAKATKTVTVTVGKAKLTVTADSKTMYVGKPLPDLTFAVTKGALVGSDTLPASLVPQCAADGSAKGAWPIAFDAAALSEGGFDEKYDVTLTSGTLTVLESRTQKVAVTAAGITASEVDGTAKIDATVSEVPDKGAEPLNDPSKLGKLVYKSSDESVATVDENGVVTIVGTGKADITVYAEGGDEFAQSAPATVTLTVEPLKVINGAGGKHIIGSGKDLSFRANGKYAAFLDGGSIEVDGETVDPSNYTHKEGSTIVDLGSKYLDTLAVGAHKLTYVYKNGTCECRFYVEKTSGGSPEGPKTGDTTNILLLVNVFLYAAIAAVFFARRSGWKLHLRGIVRK